MNKKLTAAILAGLTMAATTSVFAATPEQEIADLKSRIAALEKSLAAVQTQQQAAPKASAPNITITGESRIRFMDDDKDEVTLNKGTKQFDLRQRLYLNAKINDQISYTGRLEATMQNGNNTTGTARFNQNYFTIKDFGVDKVMIGRMPAAAGMNLNVSKPSDNDGIILVEQAGKVTLTGFVLEEVAEQTQFNGIYAGMPIGKNTDVAIGYTRGDANPGVYPEAKSLDIGVFTKLGDDFSLVGEYVDTNNSQLAGADDADAWAVQVVKGVTTKKVGTLSTNMTIVDKSKPHTDGYVLGYRNVEKNGLWAQGTAAPFNASFLTGYNITDNVKGWYAGYQNVVAKNTIFTLEYQDLDVEDTGVERDRILTSHVQFFF